MKRHSLLFVALFLIASTSLFAQIAAVPPLMNFQGRLAKPDGTPVADGTYSIRFSLWDVASGGTAGTNEKWKQTVGAVTVKHGTFAVLLSGFPAGAFNGNLYLEIKIGSDAPLTPRQPLVSVAYAMKTDSIKDGGVTTNSLADGAVTAAKILDGTVGSAHLASDAASLTKVSGGNLSISSNRLFVTNGVIQKGGSALTGVTDLGLYSQVNGHWMRFVTNNAPFQWYADGGIGTTARMSLSASGELTVNGPDNNGSTAGLRIRSGTQNMLLDGNEIDSNEALYLNHNSANNVYLATGGGNVGIGTTAPKQRLHNTGGYYGRGHLWLHAYEGDGASGTAFIQARDDSGASSIGMYLRTQNAGTYHNAVRIFPNGRIFIHNGGYNNVGVNIGDYGLDYTLSVEGRMIANAYSTSDARFKKNIARYEDALQAILRLNGVTYEWRRDEFKERRFLPGRHIGFLAQDLEKVMPELVFTDSNGYKSVNYTHLLPVVVEAIKTQQSQITTMQATKDAEISELKAQVKALTEAVRQLQEQRR